MPSFLVALFPTDGYRRLAMALVSMALLGAVVGLVVAVRLGHGGVLSMDFRLYDLWLAFCGAIGGALSLWLMRNRLGQPGGRGALRAAGGVAGVTLLAPIIAGSLALPLYGTMFGPFTLAVMFAGAPVLILLWVVIMALVHVLMLRWTAERDSIFNPLPPEEVRRGRLIPRRGNSGSI